ncbi:MAG: HEAT repeat domain-containing protein [Candidatus Polarisedimenticolia bacterium]
MSAPPMPRPGTDPTPDAGDDERSDARVVLQFFIVPLALVAVLVAVFFGLQFLRTRTPDARAALGALERYEGFLSAWVGDLKRWQYGYDLSVLLRDPQARGDGLTDDLTRAFRDAGRGGDLELRRYLALVLGRSGDPRAGAPLREGLEDPDAMTRLFSAWGLMAVQDRGALPALRRALGDPDGGVRKAAAFALGEMADAEGAAALIAALDDQAGDVRWNAALALSRLDRPEGAPVLTSLLEESAFLAPAGEGAPAERALNAIRGLARLRDPRSRPILERVAGGAVSPEVRAAAGLALEAIPAETH